MKCFNLTKNLKFYTHFEKCTWDNIRLVFIPTLSFSMFRPDEYGVSGQYELIFEWFNFSAEFCYVKTYTVNTEDNNYKSEY